MSIVGRQSEPQSKHLVPISPSSPCTSSLTSPLLETSSIRTTPLTSTVVRCGTTTAHSASGHSTTPAYSGSLAIDQRETRFVFDMEVRESARTTTSKGLCAFLPTTSRTRPRSLSRGWTLSGVSSVPTTFVPIGKSA